MRDPLEARGKAVGRAYAMLQSGGKMLELLPGALRRIIESESWRSYLTPNGRLCEFTHFEEFVVAPLGLDTSVEMLERVVKDDDVTVTLLRRALKRGTGGRPKKDGPSETPLHCNGVSRGNRTDYACDVIERERPDLFTEIVAGNLSPHRAMVIAGHRPERVSIRLDDMSSAANTLRKKLSRTQLLELAHLLATEPGDD